MINIRSWDSHCPILATAQSLFEAQQTVTRLQLGDVWYDVAADGSKVEKLQDRVHELKYELRRAKEEIDDLERELERSGDGDTTNQLEDLREEADAANRKLVASKQVVANLDKHLDLMKAIVKNA